jgi:hypothetical protein
MDRHRLVLVVVSALVVGSLLAGVGALAVVLAESRWAGSHPPRAAILHAAGMGGLLGALLGLQARDLRRRLRLVALLAMGLLAMLLGLWMGGG